MSVIKKVSFGTGSSNPYFFSPKPTNSISTPAPVQEKSSNDGLKISNKSLVYISSAVAVAALGFSTYSAIKAGNLKRAKNLDDVAAKLEQKITALQQSLTNSEGKQGGLRTEIEKVTKALEELKKKTNSRQDWNDGFLNDLDARVKTLNDRMNTNSAILSSVNSIERNLVSVNIGKDINREDRFIYLLENRDADNKRILLPKSVIEEIQKTASNIINKKVEPPKLQKSSTIWSLTAESIPEKEGGLGEVPVQIAKNMTNELGISNYLLRPLNEIPGKSNLIEQDGKYYYRFTDNFNMELQKILEFDISSFRNGRTERQPIEVFVGKDPKYGYQRIMFKNKDYFSAAGLYKNSQTASERERFVFFSKAVYEFAKIKLDPKSNTSYKIINTAEFNRIPAPDAMLLNDWHTAAVASLNKVLAPIEAANKELSEDAAKKLKEMNIVELIHNADYQGKEYTYFGDLMNTLYGKYAHDVYEYADTGLKPEALKKAHVIDFNLNLANLAASYANKLKPVSPTYAKEIAIEAERGRDLQHVFQIRLKNGSMRGQSNGWDKVVNEISDANLISFNNRVNGDKFKILDHLLEKYKLRYVLKEFQVKKDKPTQITCENFAPILARLKEIGSPDTDKLLAEMETLGAHKLRNFKPVKATSTIDEIMEARRNNKAQFIDMLKAMYEVDQKRIANGESKLFNLIDEGVVDLARIKPEDLDNIVVINCGTRFVSQKGIDILTETMKQVNEEWATKYKKRPRPLFVVGGENGEPKDWQKLVKDYKEEAGKDAANVIDMDGFTPNPIFQGGSDLTLFPSHFEPDGSKWESLYKGTPVVATRVGGHVDSIIDGVNGFLTERTVPEIQAICAKEGYDVLETKVYDFKEALYRAIDTFYDKKAYRQMVLNDLAGDVSWLIKDKDGNIVSGSLLGHLEDLGFNLDDFQGKIASADARRAYEESQKLVATDVKQPKKKIIKGSKPKKANKVSV